MAYKILAGIWQTLVALVQSALGLIIALVQFVIMTAFSILIYAALIQGIGYVARFPILRLFQ